MTLAVGSAIGGLDPAIRVVEREGMVRYFLPRRELGKLRWVGLIPLGIVIVAGSVWASHVSQILLFVLDFFQLKAPWYVVVAVGVFLPLTFFMVMKNLSLPVGMMGLGIGILFSSWAEIVLDADTIRDVEHAGWFTVTVLRRKRESVRTLRVANAGIGSTDDDSRARFFSIQALPSPDSTKKDFAPAYPRAMLEGLARDLGRRMGLSDLEPELERGEVAAGAEIAPAITSGAKAGAEMEAPMAQPANSKVMVMDEPAGLTVMIPPLGLRRYTGFLLFFGLAWTVSIVLFAIVMAFAGLKDKHGQPLPLLLLVPMMGIFLGIGVGMILISVQVMRRKAVLILSADTLTFSQTGPFRKTEKQYPRASITAVRMGDSSVTVQNTRLQQLQIHFANGPRYGLLTGREPEELEWLAGRLNAALKSGLASGV